MELICHIILFSLLGIVFYQDWKYRAISWLVFPAVLLSTSVLFLIADISYETLLFNLIFLTVVFGSLFMYISAKRGQFVNIFKADLGLGDLLFLIAMTPLFSDRNFILFFISGMMLSGLFHLLIFKNGKQVKIPLAGYLALYVITLKSCAFFIQVDLFYKPLL